MGFKHQAKVYKLIFDDPELEGLEVRAKSLSIGELRKFMAFSQDEGRSAEQTEEVLAAFTRALVSWNLEGDDGPVPATAEGINAQDPDFLMIIVNAWTDAVSGVNEELGKDSPSGKRSLEASLPMETLSESRAS